MRRATAQETQISGQARWQETQAQVEVLGCAVQELERPTCLYLGRICRGSACGAEAAQRLTLDTATLLGSDCPPAHDPDRWSPILAGLNMPRRLSEGSGASRRNVSRSQAVLLHEEALSIGHVGSRRNVGGHLAVESET